MARRGCAASSADHYSSGHLPRSEHANGGDPAGHCASTCECQPDLPPRRHSGTRGRFATHERRVCRLARLWRRINGSGNRGGEPPARPHNEGQADGVPLGTDLTLFPTHSWLRAEPRAYREVGADQEPGKRRHASCCRPTKPALSEFTRHVGADAPYVNAGSCCGIRTRTS